MKTMQQRLQSRISLRRNFIAQLESDADLYKTAAEGQLRWIARNIRDDIKPLALDQKLDKELFNYLTGMGQIFGGFSR